MIGSTDDERAAMRRCLRPFGNALGTIGFDKRPADYTEEDALRIIDCIVGAYSEAIADHHEATQFPFGSTPPVRPNESHHNHGEFQDDPLP